MPPIVKLPAGAIVLAGGSSTRLGFDKRSLRVGGVPIVEHLVAILGRAFEQVIVSADDQERFAHLEVEVVVDNAPGIGPLMALASCLSHSRHDKNFLMACDVPRPPMDVVRALIEACEGHGGAVPVTEAGHLEPLFAVYRRVLLPEVARLLASGERRLRPLIEGNNFAFVALSRFGVESIPNINTPEDLARHRELLEGAEGVRP